MKRTAKTTATLIWRQTVVRESIFIVLVGASDYLFGHAGAAFSTAVAVSVILQRGCR